MTAALSNCFLSKNWINKKCWTTTIKIRYGLYTLNKYKKQSDKGFPIHCYGKRPPCIGQPDCRLQFWHSQFYHDWNVWHRQIKFHNGIGKRFTFLDRCFVQK